MQLHPAHPQGKYTPSPLIDLTDDTVRQDLSAGAVKAFFNIMAEWNIRDLDARALLGSPSNGSFYALKKGGGKPLDEDRIRRVSYVVGIFKALNILHAQPLADDWITLHNSNRIFGGQRPLDYLIKGGLPAFATVRRLLDARRGGQ